MMETGYNNQIQAEFKVLIDKKPFRSIFLGKYSFPQAMFFNFKPGISCKRPSRGQMELYVF